MNDLAAEELKATAARMRDKAQSKRTSADNLSGQIDQMQRRIASLLNDAADLDTGADAIDEMVGVEHVSS